MMTNALPEELSELTEMLKDLLCTVDITSLPGLDCLTARDRDVLTSFAGRMSLLGRQGVSVDVDEAAEKYCASCGIAESDDEKLKKCNDCDLVRYCSDKCQQDHRSQHEASCKERAAELRDKILFRQPESSHLGDCPICCLPLPLTVDKVNVYCCCSKIVCRGCSYENCWREEERKLDHRCPFCRHPQPETQKEVALDMRRRIEKKDPVVARKMGLYHHREGEYESAFECWTKSAALGDAISHFYLSCMIGMGRVSRRIRKMKHTVWKKQPFKAIQMLDTILLSMR